MLSGYFTRQAWLCTCLGLVISLAPYLHASEPVPPLVAFDEVARLELPALRARLEAAGWPTTHVQAVIGAEIQRRYNPPFVPTADDIRPFEFWRTGPDSMPLAHLDTPERRRQQGEQADEAMRIFDELFPPAQQEPDLLLQYEDQRKWGALAGEKRAKVEAHLAMVSAARDDFLHQRGGMLNRDEWQQLWAMNRQARAGLAALLTPEELLDYDLRNAVFADQMRTGLDNFQPSRAEFLTIFRLTHPLELDFGDKPEGIDPQVDAQRIAAEQRVERQIAEALGPDRYADYRLSLELDCQRLQYDGRFFGADAKDIRRIYRHQKAVQAELAKLENPDSPKAAALKQALYQELRAIFDDESTRRYLSEIGLWP